MPKPSRRRTRRSPLDIAADRFGRELETRLRSTERDVTARLLRDAERTLRRQLEQLLKSAVTEALSGDSRASSAAAGSKARAVSIENFAAKTFAAILGSALGGRRTTRRSTGETSRSREALDAFRNSRSQQQAELVAQARRGQRNL